MRSRGAQTGGHPLVVVFCAQPAQLHALGGLNGARNILAQRAADCQTAPLATTIRRNRVSQRTKTAADVLATVKTIAAHHTRREDPFNSNSTNPVTSDGAHQTRCSHCRP